MSKAFHKKVEGEKHLFLSQFPVVFFLSFFMTALFAVSLEEEPKNTTQVLTQIKPKIPKQIPKKWYVAFFLFPWRPSPIANAGC
jgi:hypothetical protein